MTDWLPYALAAAGLGLLVGPGLRKRVKASGPRREMMLKGLRKRRQQLRDFILQDVAVNGREGLEGRIEARVRQRFGNAAIWITLLKILLPLLLQFLDNLDDDDEEEPDAA